MTEIQTPNQATNAYEVTEKTNTSKWGSAIKSLAAEFRNIKAGASSKKALAQCRDKFYRTFWELSRTKSKAVLWCRGFGSEAHEDAKDAASAATNNLLKQEMENTGVFGLGPVDDQELCAYLSGAICRGARHRVREVLSSHRRARGLWPAGSEELDEISDPVQDDLVLQQICMDIRDVSVAIAPKYKGRLPRAGKTPLSEVLIDVLLDKVESDLAKRTYQRLKKDVREDFRSMMDV